MEGCSALTSNTNKQFTKVMYNTLLSGIKRCDGATEPRRSRTRRRRRKRRKKRGRRRGEDVPPTH